jgi:hypothetical protein
MVAFQGCELESEDYGAINTSIFPKTATDAETLVTGCYLMLSAGSWANGIFGLDKNMFPKELSSDIGETGNTHPWREVLLYAQWTNNTHGYVDQIISNAWEYTKTIGAITLNIDRISAIDMDEKRKNRLIAELRCARGLVAFVLYDTFGPVPLPDLETLKNPLDEKILPRATEEEMQKFIEDDLWAAINTEEVPDVYKKGDAEYGRFSRGIAYFVLLKHYMQARKWADAEAAGRELLKPKYGYGLMPSCEDIFKQANEKNKETIFSNSLTVGYEPHVNSWYTAVFPTTYDFGTYKNNLSGVIWNMFQVAWWFVRSFDADDPRGQEPMLVRQYNGTDGKVHNEANDKLSDGEIRWGAIPVKYELVPVGTTPYADIDFIIYRYADALTLLAEAMVRNGRGITEGDATYTEGGQNPSPLALLNAVRTRSLPGKPYEAAKVAGEKFLDAVLEERAFELYWEGCRRQDLVRHGKYVERMQFKATEQGSFPTAVSENHARFPLPQSVINEGKGIILQNPGY